MSPCSAPSFRQKEFQSIDTAVQKFLECGDLEQGFARVRCPECAYEFFVAFSCRGRCFWPSCHQKRALQTAHWVSEKVCAAVPHRQFVFTIPKRLRIYFRFDRWLLGQLCRRAWEVVRSENRLGRFPEAASDDLLAGPKRNFQIFDPLDFLAEVTQQVADAGEHLIKYYGWYSNKKGGQQNDNGVKHRHLTNGMKAGTIQPHGP